MIIITGFGIANDSAEFEGPEKTLLVELLFPRILALTKHSIYQIRPLALGWRNYVYQCLRNSVAWHDSMLNGVHSHAEVPDVVDQA